DYSGTSGSADTAKLAVYGVGSSTNSVSLDPSSGDTIEAVSVATTGTNFFSVAGGTKAATFTITGDGNNTISALTGAALAEIDASAATGTQSITVSSLGLGQVVKGGTGSADKLSSTVATTGTVLPTVSGFETLSLNFTS